MKLRRGAVLCTGLFTATAEDGILGYTKFILPLLWLSMTCMESKSKFYIGIFNSNAFNFRIFLTRYVFSVVDYHRPLDHHAAALMIPLSRVLYATLLPPREYPQSGYGMKEGLVFPQDGPEMTGSPSLHSPLR